MGKINYYKKVQRNTQKVAILTLILLLLVPGSFAPRVSAASPDPDSIKLAFAGDILLDGFVGDQIARYGVNFPFAKVAPVLKEADIAFANLETPVSVRGKAAEKTFAFRSKPDTLGGLTYAGKIGRAHV